MKLFFVILHMVCKICLAAWEMQTSILKTSLNEFRQGYQNPEDPLSELLNDVLSGALEGRRATLMMDREGLDFPHPLDPLIQSLESPVGILRLPKHRPDDSNISEFNFRNSSFETLVYLGDATDDSNVIPLFQSVLIILYSCEDGFVWPFWKPPAFWSAVGVLVVSTCPSCWKQNILEYPLIEKASSLTFICPNAQRNLVPAKLGYKVRTWLPFASGGKFVDLGPWDVDSFDTWNKLFTDRFQDMGEMTLRVAANPFDSPIFYINDDGEITGVNYEILNYLSKWLHFQSKFNISEEHLWDILRDLVRREESDVMINFSIATPERNQEFQITVPYQYAGYGVMLRIPPPMPRWRNIYYPFSWQVWSFTLVSFFGAVLAFRSLHYWKDDSTYSDFVTLLKSLLSEPIMNVPPQWRDRLFLLLWWITSWILTISYSCNLIAILTLPVFPKRIQTLQEFAESDNRLCMFDYGEFVPEALRTSTHSTLSSLGKKLDLVPVLLELPEQGLEACVERVIAGTHGQTETYPFILGVYKRMNFGENVYALREYIYPNHLIFLINKHSPWKFKFDVGLQRSVEVGLSQKWYQEAFLDLSGGHHKDTSLVNELHPLTIDYLQGPFYTLLFGLSVSSTVFVFEMFTSAS